MNPRQQGAFSDRQQGKQQQIVEEQQEISEEDMQNQEIQMLEMEEIEQNSQKMIEKLNLENKEQQNQNKEPIYVVKNPISPYLMFVKSWRKNHPDQKLNISNMGELWKGLTIAQKLPHQQEFKEQKKLFQEYQAKILMRNPSANQKQLCQNKYLFPLHRIKSIMKQDPSYAPKAEAVSTFAKATEYFGIYLLDEVKKVTEGKGRIDSKHLYDCISNQRTLYFLECLIQEHNKEQRQVEGEKKTRPSVVLEMEIEEQEEKDISPNKVLSEVKRRSIPATNTNKSNNKLQAGQKLLTDMFLRKN